MKHLQQIATIGHTTTTRQITCNRLHLSCNTLQRTAAYYNTLQRTANYLHKYWWMYTLFRTWRKSKHATLPWSRCTRLLAATHCNILQRTATYCNTLQHTATYCNAINLLVGTSARVFIDFLRICKSHHFTYVRSINFDRLCEWVHTATHRNTPQHTTIRMSPAIPNDSRMSRTMMQCVAVCVAVCCSVLQCVTMRRDVQTNSSTEYLRCSLCCNRVQHVAI